MSKHTYSAILRHISSALPMVKWIEHFEEYLNIVLESNNVPLFYITRKEDTVSPVSTNLQILGGLHTQQHIPLSSTR